MLCGLRKVTLSQGSLPHLWVVILVLLITLACFFIEETTVTGRHRLRKSQGKELSHTQKRLIFHLLAHSQMATVARIVPDQTLNFIQVSHIGGKGPNTWSIFHYFVRDGHLPLLCIRRDGSKIKHPGLEQALIWKS